MKWNLFVSLMIIVAISSCATKRRLYRSRRRAARSSRIPYAALSTGAIPSRVRNRLRGNRRTSSTGSMGTAPNPAKSRASTGSDVPSAGYDYSSQYSGHGGVSQSASQQQYPQQLGGGRQVVPAGTSSFPFATSNLYAGPSQNRYGSQPIPMPSYPGSRTGYQALQTPRYPAAAAPVQHAYFGQQATGMGYSGGYPAVTSQYGSPYGLSGTGNSMPQMQYGYGSYGAQSPYYYAGAGYANPYNTIGSPYRQPNSMFSSYVHPQASSSYGNSDPYYGSSPYGSDPGENSNPFGGSSYQQSPDIPTSGSSFGYGQDRQTNSFYGGYGQLSDQSAISGADNSRGYGQSETPYYSHDASGSQYTPGTSNSYQAGSQSTYDGAGIEQSGQYDGSYGSARQAGMSGGQSSSYADYAGNSRTGPGVLSSSHQQLGSRPSMQSSPRYTGRQTVSVSRSRIPSSNMRDSSALSPSYYQAGRDDTSQSPGRQPSFSSNFNSERVQSTSHQSASQGSLGTENSRNPGGTYQGVYQGNPSAVASPNNHQQLPSASDESYVRPSYHDSHGGTYVSSHDTRVSAAGNPQQLPSTSEESYVRPSLRESQSGLYMPSHGTRVSASRDSSSYEDNNEQPTPETPSSSPDAENALSKCQAKSDGLPDLKLKHSDLQHEGIIYLATKRRSELTCAISENCISNLYPKASQRLLLRFPTIVHNVGTADFSPDLPAQNWTYHRCHGHYHSMDEFAHFSLHDVNGTVVGVGHKVSFCLQDSGCTNPCKPRYQCTKVEGDDRGTQAISPGCYDDYKGSLDCQWIDITGMPTNNVEYTLKIVVNPAINGERAVAELSYLNNAVACKITIKSTTEVQVDRCYQL